MPSESEAYEALDVFLDLVETEEFGQGESGEFRGWKYWRGKDRAVLLPTNGEFVYKFGLKNDDPNYCEHENMSYLLDKGFGWAWPITLFHENGKCILAMPYFPFDIKSFDEIPELAKALGTDVRIENFKRGYDGAVRLVDAGDIYPH